MRRLLANFRRRAHHNADQDNSSTDTSPPVPPPLPLLPDTAQRRPLTPTETANPDRAAALGIFARLPSELRRIILVEAFGNRTLHLDLQLVSQRQAPSAEFSSADYEHGRGAALLSRSSGLASLDNIFHPAASPKLKAQVKEWHWEWRWYGCVCHRLLPRGSAIEHRVYTSRGINPYIWPHRDVCLSGAMDKCQKWPTGPVIESKLGGPWATCDAAIGALGWLCACRQAYVEGIEVLYATNTFFFASRDRDLLEALIQPAISHSLDAGRRLLLPQRTAMINSLELRLEVLLFGRLPAPPPLSRNDWYGMRQLPDLAALAISFPNLHHLVLSFSDVLYNDIFARPAARLSEVDALLLRPLGLALADLSPRLEQQAVVELPSNVFRDLTGLGLEEVQRGDEYGDGKGTWLRYPVGSSSGFYYIKQGDESDLFWDYMEQARRHSAIINHTDPHATHLA